MVTLRIFLTFVALLGIAPTWAQKPTVAPLVSAHAHNDYEHKRPLFDALDNGFCSIEADVHLVDGKLLVAHDRKDAQAERTLQALYLNPLRAQAKRNRGRIYRNGPRSITLLVDVKTEAVPTYAALQAVLVQYKDLLTEYQKNKTTHGAVTVVLSGNRPSLADLSATLVRYAAYDGRLSDLDKNVAPSLMPLVSQEWAAVSTWNGDKGTAPLPEEQTRIAALVDRAHRQGYRLRFWATPDTPTAWQVLRDLHVDLINTNDLAGLRDFLLKDTRK